MTCRTFDPSTATLNHAISVHRTEGSTLLLNVPRDIAEFTAPMKRPNLLDRVANLLFAR